MKTYAFVVFSLFVLSAFAQGKKSDCQKIKRQDFSAAKSFDELIKNNNGCKFGSSTTTARVNGVVQTSENKSNKISNETKKILSKADNDTFVYIDVIFDCGGKNQTRKFCFQIAD